MHHFPGRTTQAIGTSSILHAHRSRSTAKSGNPQSQRNPGQCRQRVRLQELGHAVAWRSMWDMLGRSQDLRRRV